MHAKSFANRLNKEPEAGGLTNTECSNSILYGKKAHYRGVIEI